MGIETKKRQKIEVLVSTMHKTSLAFLEAMFVNNKRSDFDVLVVNQWAGQNGELASEAGVRVLNTTEKGLSKSRNLALKQATGTICLIADDDVLYVPDLQSKIYAAFDKHPDAAIITFKMEDHLGRPFKAYHDATYHNEASIRTVNSVVIAFRREVILDSGLQFNEHFGLGAQFETADEFIFMSDALKQGLTLCFEPVTILEHTFESSGRDDASDRLVYARSALFYKYSGAFGYLKLCKYLYLVWKAKLMQITAIPSKFLVGIKGIAAYRKLLKKGLERR